jgi:chromosome segregation ATPase
MNLEKFGIAGRWPKVAQLQQELTSLEQRQGEADAAVVAARNAIPAAEAKDREADAKAIRAGEASKAQYKAKAQAALEDAERTLAAYGKAIEDARVELAALVAAHRTELRSAVIDALRENDQALAQHAREAARRYAFREDAQYDLKELTPPTPPDENAPAQRNSFELLAHHTTNNTPNRGDVEGMLGYLAGLVSQYPEPEPTEPPPKAAKVSTPASGATVGVGGAGAGGGANDNG